MIRTVGVVSLSAGTLGEDFVRHELELGVRRLEHYGLKVKFLPHALKGIDYVKAHPEQRAADLLEAFRDPEIDLILCAIGGDDTYRLLPYLFEEGRLEKAARQKPFLGFSDSTVNHFMLHKAGISTFYGQAFLSDVCEMDREMLPYTRRYFEELLRTGTIRQVKPGDVWYEGRTDYGPDRLGTPLPSHPAGAESGAGRCPPTPPAAGSCCRGRRSFAARFWAAAWTPFMISSTADGTPICRFCADSMACSPARRTGTAVSCCWRPARNR